MVLVVALIVLVAMTLAGIALVRSVDTGNIAAGNMAFKQGATIAADSGIEAGIDWLTEQQDGGGLNADRKTDGYYATNQSTLDVTNRNLSSGAAIDWNHNNCDGLTGVTSCIKPADEKNVTQDSKVLYRYSYIIHRLCSKPSSYTDPDNSCVTYCKGDSNPGTDVPDYVYGRPGSVSSSGGSGSSGSSGSSGGLSECGISSPYYRITTRVIGPRNTVSFVQTVVHY